MSHAGFARITGVRLRVYARCAQAVSSRPVSDVRFFHVAVAHWPVFILLAGFAVVMVVVAQVRRDDGSGDDRSGDDASGDDASGDDGSGARVGTLTLLGWALVFILPPVVYVLALAAAFSVQASIFAALMAATVLLWVFGLVEEFVGPLVAVVGSLFVGLAPLGAGHRHRRRASFDRRRLA